MTKNVPRVMHVLSLLGAAILCASHLAWGQQAGTQNKPRECSGLEPDQQATYRVDVVKWREEYLKAAKAMGRRPSLRPGSPARPDDTPEIDRIIAETPSQFEDPGAYRLLSHLAGDIEKARSALALPVAALPCFGTLPIPTVNARAARVPGDSRPYIIVNRSLFPFVHEMTKLAMLTVEFVRAPPPAAMTMRFGPDAYERQLARHPEIRERMIDLVTEYLGGARAPALLLPPEYDTLLAAADQGAELFAVGHEYAHLIHKHLDESNLASLPLLADFSRVTPAARAYVHSWRQEIEADATALRLTEKALDLQHARAPRDPINVATEFSRRTPLLFLRYADIVREALDVKLNGQLPARNDALIAQQIEALKANARGGQGDIPGSGRDEHPPSAVRLALIKESVKGWEGLSSVQPSMNEHAFVGLAEALDTGLQRLWTESRHLLLESRVDSRPGRTAERQTDEELIRLTDSADPTLLLLNIGPHPAAAGGRADMAAIFVNQSPQCSLPEISTVRFTAQDGITIARPGARLSREEQGGTCTEAVAAILQPSEARLLLRASAMTIEFAGRKIVLSAVQFEDFRRGLAKHAAPKP